MRMKCLANKAMALNRQIHLKWWTKSRTKWVEMNDKNTRYFHRLVKYKQRINSVMEISVGGVCLNETKEIMGAFVDWYKELWGSEESDEVDWNALESLNWRKIPKNKHKEITSRFSEKEVKAALNSLGLGKAPGPDGYSLEFFLNFWEDKQ
ncbi:hypothetical protein Cni_G09025 [Canna indica]|uniref:Uncharacterized protein n=1 Tax=Canna indica TaxID=4628 RepID=A0AAQ3K1X1_9LILI|nr:hypothetical protein Cni_G09025 [Canna indica]